MYDTMTILEIGEDELVDVIGTDKAYDEEREREAYAQLCKAYDDELTFLQAIDQLIRGE